VKSNSYGTALPQWRVSWIEDSSPTESYIARAYGRVKAFINPTDGSDGKFTITRAETYINH